MITHDEIRSRIRDAAITLENIWHDMGDGEPPTLEPPEPPVVSSKKGVAGPGGKYGAAPEVLGMLDALNVGWWYNWDYREGPLGNGYVPMIRVRSGANPMPFVPEKVALYPTGTTWLLGNEPDDQGQDKCTPMEYAVWLRGTMKEVLRIDPAAGFVVGGFKDPSQHTRQTYVAQLKSAYLSLRNQNLDDIIKGWHVHAYAHPYAAETREQACQRVQRQFDALALCQR
jgi:hypothetical protein